MNVVKLDIAPTQNVKSTNKILNECTRLDKICSDCGGNCFHCPQCSRNNNH